MSERAKHYLLFVLLGLTTVPFFFIVNLPVWGVGTGALKSESLYLSAAFGYVGISLLVWELALGTRAIAGLYFMDLVSKLRLHRWLGTYGMLLVFLHPLLVMYDYGESLAYVIWPNLQGEFAEHVTYGRLAFMGLLLIWVTSALVRGKIAYRPWKYIHYLSYPVLALSLLHVPAVGSSFHNPWVQFFWLSFCAVTIICIALRTAHFFGYGRLAFRITESRAIADGIYFLRLEPMERGIGIRTGQYVYLQSRMYGEEHPFSVLDHDDATGAFTVAFKVYGRFTEGLAHLPKGDALMVDGPYGTFTHELALDPARPAVFIAGGIGITPFVKHAMSHSESRYVFAANQTRQTAVFRDALREGLGDRFVEVFSREPRDTAVPGQEVGRLSAAMLAKYLERPQDFHYYLCGPQGLMDAAKEALAELGVPEDRVRAEEFGF